MEWKKQSKIGKSLKGSQAEIKSAFNIIERQTKRKKAGKHKKILTEGVNHCVFNQKQDKNAVKLFSQTQATDTGKSFYDKTLSQPSKSYHTASSSILSKEFDKIGQYFTAENDRLRNALNCFEERFKKATTYQGAGRGKESISEKIKKQNILLRSGFSPVPLR